MIGRYKEIWYGVAIGISMWILDAMMHASMHGHLNRHTFIKEIFVDDATQLFFRSLFVVVALAFGFTLWRSNLRKDQVEDLQTVIDLFHRQTVNPLLLIVGYCRLLSFKEGWPVSRQEIEIIHEIQLNAQKLGEVINQLPPPGTPFLASKLTEAACADGLLATEKRKK
jgi:hypothetical protein